MTVRPTKALIAALLLAMLPGLAPADGGGFSNKHEAAAEARRQVNGRILSIRLRDRPPAPPEYRVKVLKDGDVHLLRLPARRKGNRNARPRR